MKRYIVNKRVFSIFSVLLIAAFLTACAAPEAEAPEAAGDKVIKIGSLVDFTGVLSDTQGIHWGAAHYWRYVNDEKGGINGIPVKLEWGDFSYEVPKAISHYKRLRDEGIVAINVITSSGASVALKAFCEADQIPTFSHGSAQSIISPPGWVYFNRPSYEDMTCAAADYIMETWDKEQAPKVAFVTWDNEFGRAPINAQPYMEGKGMEIIGTEFIPLAVVDITTQLKKVIDAGADIIFTNVAGTAWAGVLRNGESIGVLDKAQWWTPAWAQGNADVVYGLAGKSMTATIFPDWHCSFDEDVPGVKLMERLSTKYRGFTDRDGGYINGFLDALLLEACIQRALDEEGWPVTGPAVKKQLDQLKLSSDEILGLAYEEDFTKWPDARRGCMWYRVGTFTEAGDTVYVDPDWRKVPDFMYGHQ